LTSARSGATISVIGLNPLAGGTRMNETSWLCCTDPGLLLRFHERQLSARKLRLFACACTRRVWPLLMRESARNAVLTAERYADGEVGRGELQSAKVAVRKALGATPLGTPWEEALMAALQATTEEIGSYSAATCARSAAVALDAAWRQQFARADLAPDKERMHLGAPDECAWQCQILRDLVPYHAAALDPAWLLWEGGQVLSLARTVYEERRWQDLPVLADALEEAGCRDEQILEHCRGPGPHVRGCWLVDQIIARE
jgi:hypothetical protein